MLNLKLNSYVTLLLVVTMLLVPGISAASGLDDAEGAGKNSVPEDFFIIEFSPEQIAEFNRRIQAEVEAGKMVLDKGARAQNIWISLQQYLANQSAKIQQLEAAVMESVGNSRLKAVRDLSRNAAERERVVLSAYLALNNIAENSEFDCEIFPPGNIFTRPGRKEPGPGKSTIEIEISPHDALIKDLE